jgi:hypothetical protein
MKKILLGLILMFSASFAYAGFGMGMATGIPVGIAMGSAMSSGSFNDMNMPMWVAILTCILVSVLTLALILIIVSLLEWRQTMEILIGSSFILVLVIFNIITWGLIF